MRVKRIIYRESVSVRAKFSVFYIMLIRHLFDSFWRPCGTDPQSWIGKSNMSKHAPIKVYVSYCSAFLYFSSILSPVCIIFILCVQDFHTSETCIYWQINYKMLFTNIKCAHKTFYLIALVFRFTNKNFFHKSRNVKYLRTYENVYMRLRRCLLDYTYASTNASFSLYSYTHTQIALTSYAAIRILYK